MWRKQPPAVQRRPEGYAEKVIWTCIVPPLPCPVSCCMLLLRGNYVAAALLTISLAHTLSDWWLVLLGCC
jgi:hypothetical protein|eukprot:COSAG01_NODE_4700_length_4804_cov_14.419341_3_plen_70_part_00